MANDAKSPDPGAVSPQTADAGGFFDRPVPMGANGNKPELPGQVIDAGSESIAATSVPEAVTKAEANMAEMVTDTLGLGSNYGDQITVPAVDSGDVWHGGGSTDVANNDQQVGTVGYPHATAGDQHNLWPSAPVDLPAVDSGDVWSGG